MILLVLIPVAIVLLVNYIVAKKFEEIAFQKGYDSTIHSFAMCFWLSIIGYLYVIALPDLRERHNINVSNTDENTKDTSSNEPHEQNDDTDSQPTQNKDNKEEKYDKLVAKAERYKDTFFERDYRIRIYEAIVQAMEIYASENYKDSVERLKEYSAHLELLKAKKIK